MNKYMQGILLQLKTAFSINNETTNESEIDDAEKMPKEHVPIFHSTFKLPITYLDKDKTHDLLSTVSDDLELVVSQSDAKPMYDILFKPTHQFAKEMVPYWSKQYTSDIVYLEDTKQVLQEMPEYRELIGQMPDNLPNTDKLVEIWKSTKEDKGFMDRYSYIEWSMFRQMNESASFLQIFSIAQILSPIFSLLLPFLFLLVPFFLLKIKGVNITFQTYINMMKTITKGHFIGTILNQVYSPITIEKLAYVIFMGVFYGFQIYQNVRSCIRFNQTIIHVNEQLFELKTYLTSSIKKMKCFSKLHCNKTSYGNFCKTTQEYCKVLQQLSDELSGIEPFSYSYKKALSIGYMMKCYYRLYSIEEYGEAIRYSFGFEGYIDNLFGVSENLVSKNVTYAKYIETAKSKKHFTVFEEQYYPPHLGNNAITNTCDFAKNMIISAPNAAGKTTLLKTTAINIIFSQQVGCGFYSHCNLLPYTHIHSYLNIPDTSGRDSLFQAESRRCKEIIDMVCSPENMNARHFAILDELYSGTNPTEAGKSAYAFLRFLSKYDNLDFMLTTHYVYVCKKFKKSKKIGNFKMGVKYIDNTGEYRFTYKLEPGISKIQGAMKILQDMNYPKEMLDSIRGM
jgi:hypothetical protein